MVPLVFHAVILLSVDGERSDGGTRDTTTPAAVLLLPDPSVLTKWRDPRGPEDREGWKKYAVHAQQTERMAGKTGQLWSVNAGYNDR